MRTYQRAVEVFESEDTAHKWLKTSLPVLRNQTPLQAVSNRFGAEMEIPDELIPADFIEVLPPEEASIAGTKWLKSKSSMAIKVRSVILPPQYEKDFNVILTPEHPDFSKLTIKTVVECPFDLRLF